MSNTYTVHCLSEAASPITHASGTEGNEMVIQREPIVTPEGVRWVPALSGNALRHRAVREPGARFLVERWSLAGAMTLRQLNFLFHGGSLTESSARQDPRGFATMHRLFPLLRLIGGCLPDAIMPGNMHCWRGTLVCRENAGRLAGSLPAGVAVPRGLRPAEAFVEGWQYTRSDARNTASDLADPRQEHLAATNLMIYGGQSVVAGACFAHGFVCQHVSPLEVGALLLSLRLWQHAGGTIGGMAAKGHGRLRTWLSVDGIDEGEVVAAYVAHADASRDEAVAWLTSAFEPRPEKPAKAAKGKKGAKGDGANEDYGDVL